MPHRRSGLGERSPPKIRGGWEKSQPNMRTRSDKGLPSARGAGVGGERRRRRSLPPPQAARRPRLTPAPAPRLAGCPDSPSRAVPMSWSSRARICAWADMVASGGGRYGRDESSQGNGSGSGSSDDEGWSRRPRALSATSCFGGMSGGSASALAFSLLGNVVSGAGGCTTPPWRRMRLGSSSVVHGATPVYSDSTLEPKICRFYGG